MRQGEALVQIASEALNGEGDHDRATVVVHAERLGPQFQAKGVQLELAPGPALPSTVDAQQMGQVFTNVIGNALMYTPSGKRVQVSWEKAGGYAVVTVSDSGVGIAPEDLPHVFERFFRGRQRNQASGTGIGLTIATGIVRAHGGDLTADSAGEGHGSTFVVRIPL